MISRIIFFILLITTALNAKGQFIDNPTVSPNPFQDETNIQFNVISPDSYTLEIVDLLGQRVQSVLNNSFLVTGIHSYPINTSQFEEGLYFAILTNSFDQSTTRMIKTAKTTTYGLHAEPSAFNHQTKIYYNVTRFDTLSLYVYNRWGDAVHTFFENRTFDEGSYQISYAPDSLPSGTYTLFLKSNHASEDILIMKLNTTSIEYHQHNDIKVWPNPFSDVIHLDLNTKSDLVIRNITGKVLKRFNCQIKMLDLSDLPNGCYIMSTTGENPQQISLIKH